MKVSLQLAQQFSNVDLKSIPLDELLTRIGAQLGAVEDVTDWSKRFEGARVVRVVSCEKHPNADKLSVCRIDDSGNTVDAHRDEDGLIQVVCGAPNVHADMFAIWLPVGATVPSSIGIDPFVLTARDIRGVMSNGMLASASELGITDDHAGIVDLTPADAGRQPLVGEPFIAYLGLDDVVIDCENKMFTHRPDCFGNLGVARELAGISGLTFRSPDWYLQAPRFETPKDMLLTVTNDVPELVPRFMAVGMKGVQVQPSPLWLQAMLTRVGIKPINNVVDVTNYVMHITGQPLHAFDYDKLKLVSGNPSLMPRRARKGETLTLLGQKQITLSGDELVIATDKKAVALAGIMGGAETEVDSSTQAIVLEAATFDMYATRRTSMQHGLFTDAATRFTKGQSPHQNDRVLWYAMQQLQALAGAQQASPVFDLQHELPSLPQVRVPLRYINERLGTELIPVEITNLLKNVEFGTDVVNEADGAVIVVDVPFWRMDVAEPEDVLEEVGRLYGYHQLPVVVPPRPAKPAATNPLVRYKAAVRNTLKAYGANEVLTYSFVHGDVLQKTGTDPAKWAFHLRNAISPELQYYRTSLIPGLLSKIHPNLKAQAGSEQNHFALYEIGKAHLKNHLDEDGLPKEHDRLALVVAADEKTARGYQHGAAYYQAARYLRAITHDAVTLQPLEDDSFPISAPYQKDRSALVYIGEELVGVIGEFKASVKKALKLPVYCAGFEVDIPHLMKSSQPVRYEPLSVFPGSQQDLTLETVSTVHFAAIEKVLTDTLQKVATEHSYQTRVEAKSLYVPESADKKRFTFAVSVQHHAKTLTTQEVTAVLDRLAEAAGQTLEAQRI